MKLPHSRRPPGEGAEQDLGRAQAARLARTRLPGAHTTGKEFGGMQTNHLARDSTAGATQVLTGVSVSCQEATVWKEEIKP